MWAIADNITDETAIRAKAEDILNTFDIEGGATVETVWDMARYVVAFEQWGKDEQIAFVSTGVWICIYPFCRRNNSKVYP